MFFVTTSMFMWYFPVYVGSMVVWSIKGFEYKTCCVTSVTSLEFCNMRFEYTTCTCEKRTKAFEKNCDGLEKKIKDYDRLELQSPLPYILYGKFTGNDQGITDILLLGTRSILSRSCNLVCQSV